MEHSLRYVNEGKGAIFIPGFPYHEETDVPKDMMIGDRGPYVFKFMDFAHLGNMVPVDI